MATYDSKISYESLQREKAVVFLNFSGETTLQGVEKDRYQTAVELAAKLGVQYAAQFENLPNDDPRVNFRQKLAQQIADFIQTGAFPEGNNLTTEQESLSQDIAEVLPLFASKAAVIDSGRKKELTVKYNAKITEKGLRTDWTNDPAKGSALSFAETLLFTAADQLATVKLQTQTPSLVPVK
ncbi:MAG: hypothetical protein G01um101416_1017 [Microgenomates group bacterium Gr01-1014_16]|nr:MAG: hypothetical protein G01um101416_1017 [Microgenomates group bacterium Gr01-1014_16]